MPPEEDTVPIRPPVDNRVSGRGRMGRTGVGGVGEAHGREVLGAEDAGEEAAEAEEEAQPTGEYSAIPLYAYTVRKRRSRSHACYVQKLVRALRARTRY